MAPVLGMDSSAPASPGPRSAKGVGSDDGKDDAASQVQSERGPSVDMTARKLYYIALALRWCPRPGSAPGLPIHELAVTDPPVRSRTYRAWTQGRDRMLRCRWSPSRRQRQRRRLGRVDGSLVILLRSPSQSGSRLFADLAGRRLQPEQTEDADRRLRDCAASLVSGMSRSWNTEIALRRRSHPSRRGLEGISLKHTAGTSHIVADGGVGTVAVPIQSQKSHHNPPPLLDRKRAQPKHLDSDIRRAVSRSPPSPKCSVNRGVQGRVWYGEEPEERHSPLGKRSATDGGTHHGGGSGGSDTTRPRAHARRQPKERDAAEAEERGRHQRPGWLWVVVAKLRTKERRGKRAQTHRVVEYCAERIKDLGLVSQNLAQGLR
ncbi:hypothetical protein K438DRAFT_1927925 [Mycena galopus ATCC 62051]|nr:hypothetical protein K438DRAFT_1927925 [Mycena galopus ATCC 62051]